MGSAKKPKAVKLIIGMLARNKKLFEKAEEFFIEELGPMDYQSPVISFKYTSYYKKEMGSSLKRKFISFKKLISPEKIVKIKLLTNLIEEKLSIGNKRQVNVDPGYISDAKLILATTKDYFHRIYLDQGIYAEVTLKWRKHSFEPFEWTYPDYRSKAYLGILNKIRTNLMKNHAG
ncbi:MAG: GTP-binding protein [Candidatus Omnitrophica bacterium CG22_combo_CG10-13_8_21_14_all_43_16]|nr:MAG: GTP-binding protein [Candidatus Omnitrophica bacterium CG22_combo_CG10-13_8_21_14_all_43_16]